MRRTSRSASSRSARLLPLVAALLACDEPTPTAPRSAQPTPAPAPAPSVSTPRYEDETSTRPVELLDLRLASAVKNKEPVDALQRAVVGERVYAHLTLRNRTGRPREVTVAFTVEGVERSRVDLEVGESWSWRTWAYATMREADRGKTLTIEVTDDEGHPLAERALPVVAASR